MDYMNVSSSITMMLYLSQKNKKEEKNNLLLKKINYKIQFLSQTFEAYLKKPAFYLQHAFL